MKESPILFTPENVRKSRDDLKTQTRRIIKFRDVPDDPAVHHVWRCWNGKKYVWQDGDQMIKCPYGQPGDRLYVKEGWTVSNQFNNRSPSLLPASSKVWYLIDGKGPSQQVGRKRSPLHMPRWASRLWLELTDVRVERLQGISEHDAKAEVCSLQYLGYPDDPGARYKTYRDAFRTLWCAVQKSEDAWIENPWVWVLTYKRLDV